MWKADEIGIIKDVLVVKHVGLAESALRIPVIMGTGPVNPFVTMVIMIKDMINMVKITVFGYKKPRSPSPHLSKWEGREKRQRSIVKNFAP